MPDDLQFQAALDALDKKQLLPTQLRTALLSKLSPELSEASFFSAGVSKAPFLSAARDATRQIVTGLKESDGGLDPAKARLQLRRLAESLGYGAGGTNAFDRPISPDEFGGLLDLTSDQRLNLIIDTNTSMVRNAGWFQSGQTDDILFQFPCSELVRAAEAVKPRPWFHKWVLAGGTLYEGRMIARKDDPIWTKPISAGGFNRFGNRYPPFDYNSHMETIDVSRRESIRLGVIGSNDASPKPVNAPMNLAADLAAGDYAALVVDSLKAVGVNTKFVDGVLSLARIAGALLNN